MPAEASAFRERAESKAQDDGHRRRLLRVIHTYDVAVTATKSSQFLDWQAARRAAAEIKDQALDHLPELLEAYEQKATARGTQVLWARDAEEARQLVLGVLERVGARRVVKSKSMTSEEIELNELLEARGIHVLESDLGELIVQLADEKPYHIVTPAMHKSRAEISELFQATLGSKPTESAEELTAIARDHLREAYLAADVGITGANFIVAGDGSIAITENEGNARLSTACPKVHVAIVGIEKVIPELRHLALFWPLLATSGTGQQITGYSSILRGPRRGNEQDGPDEMIVILLDNGRSRMYRDATFRQSLRCIRCGACLNACPVFRSVGGHAYNTPYGGPIGSVITPQLKPLETWQHLPFASSLCGACSDACPVHIDLHHLLLENRVRAVEAKSGHRLWTGLFRVWSWVMRSRSRVRWVSTWVRRLSRLLPRRVQRQVPTLAPHSFADWWQKSQEQAALRQLPPSGTAESATTTGTQPKEPGKP